MSKVNIGVFICHCGSNIGGVVNINKVLDYARTLPRVKYAEDNLYTCSDAGLSSIKEKISQHDLNRVVVASCTPRTHEELFRRACEEAGLNRYLFEFVNIREHCSWIHMNVPEAATEKAMDLIRLGVMKAAHLVPLETASTDVKPAVLVIGAGVAGLTASLNLAKQGFQVHLVEQSDKPGGIAAGLWKLIPGDRPAGELVETLVSAVKKLKNVKVYLSSTVEDVSGFIGAFDVRISTPRGKKGFPVGTVIIATGARELEPLGLYSLGELEGVMTQRQLEQALVRGRKRFTDVVFINCAGARIPGREYCGRLCCATSIKNARYIREICPSARVTVLQRDMMAYGTELEMAFRSAQEAGVRFIRYDPERPPRVLGVLGNGKVSRVRVYHALAGMEVTLPASMVVLVTPLVPNGSAAELARMLKVPVDSFGFFLEAHMKLRPVEFATDGVYVAGAARFPANIREVVAQGIAAAAKAAVPMTAGKVSLEATTAKTETRLCSGCGNCELVCPFGAIEMGTDNQGRTVSAVNAVLCKGCGSCAAACPNGAIQQQGFTDLQIFSMIDSLALEGDQGGSFRENRPPGPATLRKSF
ncbi:MAG: CoB--CoM heterodisulfide reductase iron-sulfur subunit A family protein [Candidatus Aminicenantes bacterium]|nr:MAG: CoB--CoM heterodisulfide reductase iron-sulfur subunit A family protein [Candidatus Aminicenantes bacterium]